MLNIGDFVRLRRDPHQSGIINQIKTRNNRTFVEIQFSNNIRQIPIEQIEIVPRQIETPSDLILRNIIDHPTELKRRLSHVRLSGKLNNIFYAMETSDTTFYAHQFKPVLSILNSPSGNLLIADEVGLGKTIEAGIIWTELLVRNHYNKLLIICPKVLCDKWKLEMQTKFSLDAQIYNKAELVEAISSPSLQHKGFVAICGIQSLRARQNTDDILTDTLSEIDGLESKINLTIIDEAHHLRNPGTQNHKLAQSISRISEQLLFLSATPINLQSKDLHSLLKLIEPDTFEEFESFKRILYANEPIIKALNELKNANNLQQVKSHLIDASKNMIFQNTKQLKKIISDIEELPENINGSEIASLMGRIERVNLLSNSVSRTRRRDVEEFRVLRKVYPFKSKMSVSERNIYDFISSGIRSFAEKRDISSAFLLTTPQRMLASCLPAAVAYWKNYLSNDGQNLRTNYEDSDMSENIDIDNAPVKQRLALLSSHCKDLDALESEDTKFECLSNVLKKHFNDNPSEKIIVFSTFKSTILYLDRRLKSIGISTSIIHGGIRDRTSVINEFENSDEKQVLVSSEVGSEGIDLQFSSVIVNYDLPWNPMVVEQRIGRVDRLGQKSKSVSVLNLLHEDTIDERIYDRLYERLHLCETALGGFENILGNGLEIGKLTASLLTQSLTKEQESERLDQAAQAFENQRNLEEKLEKDAINLMAHGDYVLESIRAARQDNKWISNEEIVDYLTYGLTQNFPESKIEWDKNYSIVTLELSIEGQAKYEEWCNDNNLVPGKLAQTEEKFQVGKPKRKSRYSKLGQGHALMRFISELLIKDRSLSCNVVGCVIDNKEQNTINSGIYIGAIQKWTFGDGSGSQRLAYSLWNQKKKKFCDLLEAEKIIDIAIKKSKRWHTVSEEINTAEIKLILDNQIKDDFLNRFIASQEQRQLEINDRSEIQKSNLFSKFNINKNRLETLIVEGRGLVAANKGKLVKLNDNYKKQMFKIEKNLDFNADSEEIGAILLKVI